MKVVVVMGSRSDLSVMKEAVNVLKEFGVSVETTIVSAHRTPQILQKSVTQWEKKNVSVIIAGAGGAAHLPGMLASFSRKPVIGVPVKSANMSGLDALLSMAMMPKGVPVATVAVNNSYNAGLLALQILACRNSKLSSKINKFKKDLSKKVIQDQKQLKKLGVEKFLRKIK